MKDKGLVGFKLDDEGKADPSIQAQNIMIVALVCYPGSTTTDIQIGDHIFQVPNVSLEKASREADEAICDCI